MAHNETNVFDRYGNILVGTLIAGFAPTFSVLLIGRIVQAVATGLISPLLMNTILIICPPEKTWCHNGINRTCDDVSSGNWSYIIRSNR